MKPVASNNLTVDPRAVPPEGLALAGSIERDVLQLGPDPWARPQPPLEFDLTVQRSGDLMLLEGRLSSRFQLKCGRCLRWFDDRVELHPYQAEMEIEDETKNIDLTEQLREDILLALPGFPRCDQSAIDPGKCQATDELLRLSSSPEKQEPTGWEALDQLQIERQPPEVS